MIKKRQPDQGLQFALNGSMGAGGVDLTEQLGLGSKQHIVSQAHRTMSQRLCKMRTMNTPSASVM